MEQLAFIHAATAYEDPSPALELRSLDELAPKVSPSAVVGVASGVVAASLLTAAPNAQAVVQYGDVCSAVGDIQSALQDEGYYSGAIDDIFGSGTESAIIRFQNANDLSADGIVGPSTADALGLSTASEDSPFLAGNSCTSSSDGGGGGLPAGSYTIDSSTGVNVRSTPNGTVISSKAGGTEVVITSEQETAGGYTWARLSGETGWVATEFLASDESDTGTSDGLAAGTYTIDSSTGVNIRSTPNGTVIGSKADGDEVVITSEQETVAGYTWARLSGEAGWVATDFLSSSSSGTDGGGGGAPGRAEVIADALIVRSSPNGADTGETLYSGEVVRVTGVTQTSGGIEWSELSTGDWVATDYLDLL
jgi:peptidoglycan hydrolase-like protein with peptidoglycan-binding domain